VAETNGLLNRRTDNSVPRVRIPPSPPDPANVSAIILLTLVTEPSIKKGMFEGPTSGWRRGVFVLRQAWPIGGAKICSFLELWIAAILILCRQPRQAQFDD
jgi:hypothetical protein